MPKKSKKTKIEVQSLAPLLRDLHWMARRYADGRSSYATSLFNEHTNTLLKLGIKLNPTADGTIWARDSQGRAYDDLTPEQATPGTKAAKGEV